MPWPAWHTTVLSWLESFITAAGSLVPSPIRDFVHWALHGIVGVVSTVFHQVTSAWDSLASSTAAFSRDLAGFADVVFHQLWRVITYYIPHYAIYAWWWITHPEQLAERLFWYIVKALERHAWAATQVMGKFVLNLIHHNVRHLAAVMEDIITAVF